MHQNAVFVVWFAVVVVVAVDVAIDFGLFTFLSLSQVLCVYWELRTRRTYDPIVASLSTLALEISLSLSRSLQVPWLYILIPLIYFMKSHNFFPLRLIGVCVLFVHVILWFIYWQINKQTHQINTAAVTVVAVAAAINVAQNSILQTCDIYGIRDLNFHATRNIPNRNQNETLIKAQVVDNLRSAKPRTASNSFTWSMRSRECNTHTHKHTYPAHFHC